MRSWHTSNHLVLLGNAFFGIAFQKFRVRHHFLLPIGHDRECAPKICRRQFVFIIAARWLMFG